MIGKNKKMKKTVGERVFDILVHGILLLCFLIILFPLMYVVAGSLASAKELAENKFLIIPKEPTLDVYKYILSTKTFPRSIAVTTLVTIVGTFVNLIMTCLTAYPLARRNLLGRKWLMLGVTFTLVFSGGLIPTYLVVNSMGLIDKYAALIIPGAISSFNLVLVKNFFQEIPESLIEAAKIDGSSEINTLTKIVLPLSKPALATFTMFYAVGHWNQFLQPLLYLNDSKKWTVQILLRQIVMLSSTSGEDDGMMPGFILPMMSLKLAVVVVSTLPIIMAYPFMQKYFDKGVMVGSVKG
ncbi:carbohydrate ABC transporter permease [Lacrimispora sp.]|uniref:carbohydrate ABC transporter permease n=1 Tax=Lacrimispora sp. TaxID=2719234 RepID=UPI0028AE09B3|nr:carbohydrate ABC transporter permease [Lacrimispora sp.]